MASPTPEELKRAEKLLSINQALTDTAKEQRNVSKEIQEELDKNYNSVKETNKSSINSLKTTSQRLANEKEIGNLFKINLNSRKDLTEQEKRLLVIDRALRDSATEQRDVLREIQEELGKNYNSIKEANKQYNSLRDITSDILRNEEAENKLSDKDLDKLRTKAKLSLDDLKVAAEKLAAEKGITDIANFRFGMQRKKGQELSEQEEALLRAYKEGFEVEKETLKLIEARIKKTENLNKAVGVTGDFLKISENLLEKMGATNLQKPFEAARKSAEAKAKALGISDTKTASIADKFKILGSSIAGFGSGLAKAFSDPLVIVTSIGAAFTFLIKAALEMDKHLTEFSKNLGISKDAAHELEGNFDNMSYNVGQYSKNLTAGTFSIKAQMQATTELNEALGTAGLFTGQMVAGQVLLTKRLGLSNEEAAEFAKFSLLSGKSQEDITTEIGDQIIAFRKETGVQLNMKKVMQDVTKVHGQLAANLGNDPKKIAAAVMQAQKLGLTLEKTRDIASSLLDFESSIENELEAELLTGKSLNLEKARELALQGKSVEAASELMSQVGGLSEFQSLNVLQQNALAKSIGLSADEMADAYKQQELLKGTAFQTKEAFLEQYKIAEQQGKLEEFKKTVQQASNGEQLLAMGAQQSASEKFQEAIDKLKETFTRIAAGPLLHMVDKFATFISNAENLKSIINGVAKTFDMIATIIGVKMVAGLAKSVIQLGIAAVEAGIMGAGAATAASAVTFGLGAIAIIAAISSITSAMDSAAENATSAVPVQDAAINPSGGLMISGPKGSFITDPADEVVAAPGASKMLGEGGGGGGITKADIDAIANRPIMVNVQANTDMLLRLQTAQTQYGAPSSFA
jgi:hypothetical protein